MKYKLLENIEPALWQTVVDKSPCATFYHTPAWGKLISDTFPHWENISFGLEFEDGNRAILPLLRRSITVGLPYYWYESTVPGAYGGPIFEVSPSRQHYDVLASELEKYKNIMIVGNPFVTALPIGQFRELNSFVQVVYLKPDFSDVWKGYSRGRQRAIRRAITEGVVVREVDFLECHEAFYEIYLHQVAKWNGKASGNYPIRLYHNLACVSKTNPAIKLLAAFLGGKMIGGLVVFYHNQHVTLGFVATLPDFLKYHPEDVLISTVIEEGCIRGFADIDFGKSGGNNGVVKYKEYFGAIPLPLCIKQRKNILGLSYRVGRHIKNYLGKCPEE